jgi:mercuric ion transport protein
VHSPDSPGRPGAVIASAVGGLGAGLASTLAAVCCVGPAVVSVLGVGGAVAAAGLRPYRTPLLLGSLLLLGLGFFLAYRSARARSCPTRSGRVARRVLWVSGALWLVALILPQLLGA